MPEQLIVSPPAWALLDMLEQQLGVSFDVLDASLRPLVPAGASEAGRLVEQPGTAEDARKAFRSGEVAIDTSGAAPIGFFPLRVARQVVGCLVVAPRIGRTPPLQGAADRTVEGAGHLARTALEADLALSAQLADARYRTRRLHGILRFLGEFGTPGGDRDVLSAVVQAATVWFDLDCRIYQRGPEGTYVLAAALPGVEQRRAGTRIDADRAEKLIAARRLSSAGDLEDLGISGRRDEVLVLPVGTPPDSLLLLAGAIDAEVELTFGAIARVLAGDVQAWQVARMDLWQERLAGTASESRGGPQQVLLELLESLVQEVGATGVRASLITHGSERTLAVVGQADAGGEAQAERAVTHTIQIGPSAFVRVTLWGVSEAARAAAIEIRSWARALRPWLQEAVAAHGGLEETPAAGGEPFSFEHRIQEEVERAKRFNLGLGLVVIAAKSGAGTDAGFERLVASVRSELRASDLLGRLRSGPVALLLVHSAREGAESVVMRLQRRFSAAVDAAPQSVQLGRAMFSNECASADELIAQALRQAEQFPRRN